MTKSQFIDILSKQGKAGKSTASLWFNGHRYASRHSFRCLVIAVKGSTGPVSAYIIHKGSYYAL